MNFKALTEDLLFPLLSELTQPGPLGDRTGNLSVQDDHLLASHLEVGLGPASPPAAPPSRDRRP